MMTESNCELIGKFGFDIVKKKDNMTEVYKKIRYFPEEERKSRVTQVRQKLSS